MIPKKIHIAWKHKQILDLLFVIVQHGIRQLRDLNPTWSFEISDDADIEQYLKDNLARADYDRLKDRHVVEKCDVWRLLKMINEGGFYMDVDRYCNQPLDNILPADVECVLPTHYDIDFSQDIMVSCPGHAIHRTALILNLSRRKEGCTDVLSMGPITYFHAATTVLLGAPLDRWPSAADMQKLRDIIAADNRLHTYREEPQWNTFVYRGEPLVNDRDAFYQHSTVNHWKTVAGTVSEKTYGN